MKILSALAGLAVVALSSSTPSHAYENRDVEGFSRQVLVQMAEMYQPSRGLNWAVGDTQNFNLSAGMMGSGTMVKSVTKDEGDSLWLESDISISGQQQNSQMQISKADGHIMKLIVNGQNQQIPNDKPTITSQKVTKVTVPAGTFDCLMVTGKTTQVKKFTVWVNPQKTVMEGTLKQVMTQQFGNITMELTSFKHGQ